MRNNNLDKILRKYMRATKHYLICPKEYQNQFSIQMKEDLEKFILENDNVEYEDIVQFFGTPLELANFYLSQIPADELNRYKVKKTYGIAVSAVISIMILFSIIVFLSLKLHNTHEIEILYQKETVQLINNHLE